MPPRTRATAPQDEAAGKEKRKPVRRDPEKRRQQNIQAQRKYREKLRERLDRLEALAAFAAQSHAVGTSVASPGQSKKIEEHDSSSASSFRTPTDIPSYHTSDVSPGSGSVTFNDCQQLPPQLNDIPLDLRLWNPATYAPLSDDPSTLNLWDPTTQPLQPDDTILYPSMSYAQSTPSEESICGPATQYKQSTAPPALSTLQATTLSDTLLPTSKEPNNELGLSWTTTIHCGCPRPHFQMQSHGPRPFTSGNFRVLSLEPSVPLPDPYANNIRIDHICTITALYAIGTHIGLTEDILCGDDSLSHFFRPSEPVDTVTKANTVTAVQAMFKKTLKPDMRPNKEQITISHHPYIDILPFPTVRKNLITHQGEFDEDEFYHDTLTGLVCWGGAGVGNKDRNLSAGKASTGTPWDSRSWEAQVWFLKKYWSLLGGEDGELVRQTDWWRGIRGEDALDIVELEL
ncbi:hypothetical protein BDW62DRAFT_174813 [Aspergillus aurantiobrunneus]